MRRTKMKNKLVSFLVAVCVSVSLFACVPSFAAANKPSFQEVANGIISWKKSDVGSSSDGVLMNGKYLELAGTTPGDWYVIGLSRLNVADAYDEYLAVLRDRVEERYSEPGKLNSVKATEWHRITLSVLAAGGDPTSFGVCDGEKIDLVADGTYNRGKTTSLGRQGINGWIWGLIALDSKRYSVPADAYYTRDDIITEILSRQLPDGGFALSGAASDPDLTAMALQALAPYYNSEKTYTYEQKSIEKTVTKHVYDVIDEALGRLSELQLDTGDFKSWGTENVESTDQVMVALCCLGIDPLTDKRFIKKGNTLYDGILRYRMKDGGFVHSYVYDPDNPSSLPDASNTMAGEQTLYTMAALIRRENGSRTLYDFRSEQSAELKSRISSVENKIASFGANTDAKTLRSALAEYYSLPETERSYVYSYRYLSSLAKAKNIDVEKIAAETPVVESPEKDEPDAPLLYFTASDRAAVDALPEKLSTEQYVTVTTLLSKLERSEDFDGKDLYLEKLTRAKAEIAAVQAEIDALNAEIKEKLYPFEKTSLADKKTVDDIVERYNALADYDKLKIERWEDVIKTKTRIDNLLRALVIAAAAVVLIAVLAVFVALHVRKRRLKKRREMDELRAEYENEDSD